MKNKNNDIMPLPAPKSLIFYLNFEDNTPPIDEVVASQQMTQKTFIETFIITPIECECGAEKCGTTHSDWCPKYKKRIW